MSSLTEARRAGEFIVSEANGRLSRDNVTVASGQNLKAGAVVAVVAASTAETQTITTSGTGAGSHFTLTVPAHGEYPAQTTASIAWSATDATFLANLNTALRALGSIGADGVTVTSAGTNGIGVYTATFDADLGDMPLMTYTAVDGALVVAIEEERV